MTFTRRRHRRGPGAEPGVNPKTSSAQERYVTYQENCIIDVIDYSSDSLEITRMGNAQFTDLLKTDALSQSSEKKTVRWINIGGIDWDVVSALAMKYNLHALALEDVLHGDNNTRSKVDYFSSHLFLCLSTLRLTTSDDEAHFYVHPKSAAPSRAPTRIASSSLGSGNALLSMNGHDEVINMHAFLETKEYGSKSVLGRVRNLAQHFGLHHGPDTPESREVRIRALTKDDRISVIAEPMFIFVLRDGTVISIYPRPTLDFTSPITERLQQKDSVLRLNEDASVLVESLLDLVVDRVVDLTDAYHSQIQEIEHDNLIHPGVHIIRRLHILSADVIIHKRRLEPMRTLIQGIRRHDDEIIQSGVKSGYTGARTTDTGAQTPGYFSDTAKMYLADVQDHVEFALSSLDMFTAIAENQLNYAFNMASFQMNQYMRRLTMITIIFLPLTLLTGYFGMNFQPFVAVSTHSDLYFWAVAIPLTLVLFPLFIWPDITKWWLKLRVLLDAHQAVKRFYIYKIKNRGSSESGYTRRS